MKTEALVLSIFFCFVFSLPSPMQAQDGDVFSAYAGSAKPFAADFNLDGKPDILSYGIMNLGQGDGTFAAPTKVILPNDHDQVIGVADFNGDRKPDLLVGYPCYTISCESSELVPPESLSVFLGNGDGSFQTAVSIAIKWMAIAAIDLNGDAKADLVAVFNDTLFVFYGKGDGSFQQAGSYYLGCFPLLNSPEYGCVPSPWLSMEDFNGDGNPDVVVSIGASFWGRSGDLGQEIMVLGNGDGTFQPAITSDGGLTIWSVAVGDFNGDRDLDLAFSGGIYETGMFTWTLLGNGDGTFQPGGGVGGEHTSHLSPAPELAAADFNHDGKSDLVVQSDPFVSNDIEIYLGNEDGTFSKTSTYHSYLPSNARGIAIADFNNDSKQDIAIANLVLLGKGDGTFTSSVRFDFSTGDTPTITSTSAGGTAGYDLNVLAWAEFSGTVNLSCGVIPNVARAPTCAVSPSSVQLSPSDQQKIYVTVTTTAPTTAGLISPMDFPGTMLLTSILILVGTGWISLRARQCQSILVSLATLVLLSGIACGGSGSHPPPPLSPSQGTPPGTYKIIVTGTSGTHNQSIALTLTVN
jgi:hypothetical protein